MNNKFRIAVLASGRGSNLEAILQSVQAGKIAGEIVLVLSNKQQARALEIARGAGIPTQFVDPAAFADREAYDQAVGDCIEAVGAELIVLAGYMRLLSPAFCRRFSGRIINIHPALLPSFPGPHAQAQAVEAGVKISGCTVHFVDEGLDSGPIIAQRAVPVYAEDDENSLSERILEQEHLLYAEVIEAIAQGKVKLKGNKVYIDR